MSTEAEESSAGYRVKWIRAAGLRMPVCMQNKNGPCPLLAIANALLLRGDIELSHDTSTVTDEHLQSLMTEFLYRINGNIKDQPEEWVANHQMNLADAVTMLPALNQGLDVNVQFSTPDAFEFTREMSCFDLFRLRLLHGWLVDPVAEAELSNALNGMSFNQVMDRLVQIASESGSDQAGPSTAMGREQEAALLQNFLTENASQLTFHGLAELHASVSEGEFFVFFRNNHFSTAMKRDSVLYLLVSDQGYVNEEDVVWEAVHGVAGDSTFVNGDLKEYDPTAKAARRPLSDAELARQIAENDQRTGRAAGGPAATSDEKLARKLQEDELARLRAAPAGRRKPTTPPSRRKTQAQAAATKTDCCIQ